MITLVHGTDLVSSRNYFQDQKDKNAQTFDAENLVFAELELSLQGSGLFGQNRKIFIENLFTRKGTKNLEDILKTLQTTPKETDVFIWADKELGAKAVSLFPKSENKNFKIPQNIWPFVDGLRPNSLRNVSLFHSVLLSIDAEIIFAMIIRQFRLMLGLIGDSDSSIDEVKRLAPWQRNKLIRQASFFDANKLKEIYKKLYKIDKSQKTGSSKLNFVQAIDILLLQI